MAEVLEAELGVRAELVPGARGVFLVYVGDTLVAKKTLDGFPTPEQCVEAVREAL
ncbi:MAG: hypothetical protein H6736_14930 [Alphaproteobacteria bacterium]|nr:hypothetical protein [Alphaproteobacteria bacterium]MCB9693102.1 hypothetical protein [Alphaproteobacteria bacterium]